MGPIFELSLVMPTRDSHKLLSALHHQLRAAIMSGRLQAGLQLPATRKLAILAGVSRNTAVAAYELLQSQGFIIIRPNSGAFVADHFSRPSYHKKSVAHSGADSRLTAFWRNPPMLPAPLQSHYQYDFRVGLADKSAFPFQVWQRLLLRSQRAISKAPTAYAHPQGQTSLREAIATHASLSRAVACQTDDLIVTAGIQQALDCLARILVTAGKTKVAVEDPGYSPAHIAFAAAGAKIVHIPVDNKGIIVEQIPTDVQVIYVTPSHQFPLGYAMSIARRTALLNFAQSHDAVIIEDDYDCEFRYSNNPYDALQSIDHNERVFYIGTFSKCLFPSLRLGFILSPQWAKNAIVAAKRFSDWHSPTLEQETLATFITEGHLMRHLRKMRKIYAGRRTVLIKAIKHHCNDLLEPISVDSGMHVTALVKGNLTATTIAEQADKIGIGLYSLNRYPIAGNGQNGLAFGLGMIKTEKIDEAISKLAVLMRQV